LVHREPPIPPEIFKLEVLNGKRELNKNHIEKLEEVRRFASSVFLGSSGNRSTTEAAGCGTPFCFYHRWMTKPEPLRPAHAIWR
jgi:hypothetical protein